MVPVPRGCALAFADMSMFGKLGAQEISGLKTLLAEIKNGKAILTVKRGESGQADSIIIMNRDNQPIDANKYYGAGFDKFIKAVTPDIVTNRASAKPLSLYHDFHVAQRAFAQLQGASEEAINDWEIREFYHLLRAYNMGKDKQDQPAYFTTGEEAAQFYGFSKNFADSYNEKMAISLSFQQPSFMKRRAAEAQMEIEKRPIESATNPLVQLEVAFKKNFEIPDPGKVLQFPKRDGAMESNIAVTDISPTALFIPTLFENDVRKLNTIISAVWDIAKKEEDIPLLPVEFINLIREVLAGTRSINTGKQKILKSFQLNDEASEKKIKRLLIFAALIAHFKLSEEQSEELSKVQEAIYKYLKNMNNDEGTKALFKAILEFRKLSAAPTVEEQQAHQADYEAAYQEVNMIITSAEGMMQITEVNLKGEALTKDWESVLKAKMIIENGYVTIEKKKSTESELHDQVRVFTRLRTPDEVLNQIRKGEVAVVTSGSGEKRVVKFVETDQALETTVEPVKTTRGGIDLNSANLNLQIKRDGKGVPLPLAQQDMNQLMQIQGFVPEIIEIRPAVNLPILAELQQKLQPSSA